MGDRRVILLSETPAVAEARLRAAVPEAEFLPVRGGANRELLRERDPVAAVVWLDGDPEASFRLVHALDQGGTRVVVVGARKDADLILRAMREGAKEFVVASEPDALAAALRAQVRTAPGAAAGQVIAVLGAKGGVGGTTLATNLAGALHARGERACLVDLDLEMGDVLSFLDLSGGSTLSDLLGNMHRLDPKLVETSVLAHPSGVRVLSQTQRVEDADQVTTERLGALLHLLRQHFAAVVLDGLRSFDERTLAALDAADRILLLLTQEVPAVRDAARCLALFRRLGLAGKVSVVVNRFQSAQIDAAVIAETLGVPVAARLSNDYRSVTRAMNGGVLLADVAPRAAVTRDVETIARLVSARSDAPDGAARAPRLARFFRRRNGDAAR